MTAGFHLSERLGDRREVVDADVLFGRPILS
jgi:hypothetical protein